jgi:hypothetical protein
VGYGEDVLVFTPQNNTSASSRSHIKQTAPLPQIAGHEPVAAEKVVKLPFTVIGCRSLETFDGWVRQFREADAGSQAQVFAQGMQTKDCTALADGPVEIVKGDDEYLCVRPEGVMHCYWTLKAVFPNA